MQIADSKQYVNYQQMLSKAVRGQSPVVAEMEQPVGRDITMYNNKDQITHHLARQ